MDLSDVKLALDEQGFDTDSRHSVKHNGDVSVYGADSDLIANITIEEGESIESEYRYANSFVISEESGNFQEIETNNPKEIVNIIKNIA